MEPSLGLRRGQMGWDPCFSDRDPAMLRSHHRVISYRDQHATLWDGCHDPISLLEHHGSRGGLPRSCSLYSMCA